jgi:phenylalanyl-tRNA synthetase beta chain
MPTIIISKKAVQAILPEQLPDERLKERISFLGTSCEGIADDAITVEIFPNRPDLLSEQGFLRAFKAFMTERPEVPEYKVKHGGRDHKVIIDESVADVRPYTACAVVRGLSFTDERIKEAIQLQEKLHITYGRNRKRCAIGIYPLEHIELPITYTALPPEDIVFKPLEAHREMNGTTILKEHPTGKEYGYLLEGKKRYPVFMDAKGDILSMPPIINSERTGRISAETKDIFIECSGFSWEVVHGALAMIVTAFADMGGVIEEMTLEYPKSLGGRRASPQLEPSMTMLLLAYANRVLGEDLDEKAAIRLLAKMGHDAQSGRKGELHVHVPAYRVDILHPIDLVEDLAIAYGMERFEGIVPKVATNGQEDFLEKAADQARDVLVGHGLVEVKNYHLTSKESQAVMLGLEEESLVTIANPGSKEYDSLRQSLVPTVLLSLQRNRQQEYPQGIFEVGETFIVDDQQATGVKESPRVAVAWCGEDADYTKVRRMLDSLCEAFSVSLAVQAALPSERSFLLPGRAGLIMVKGEKVGCIGEVTPRVLSELGLIMPVALFEMDLEALAQAASKTVSL